MKNKSLWILVIAALALGAAAYFAARRTDTGVPSLLGHKPFADRDFNAVTRIVIAGPEGTVTVARVESGWVLPDRHGYWADFDKIRAFIRELVDLKVADVLRLSDAQTAELQLNPPDAPAGAGTRILLTGEGDRPVAQLLLGKRPRSARAAGESPMFMDSVAGRFAALESGDRVLVDNPFTDLPHSAKEWMESQFLAPPAPELVRLSISGPGRDPLELTRLNPQAGWNLTGITQGQSLDPESVNRLTSSLGFLRYNEVADPALTDAQTGLDQPARIDAETADGRRYSVLFGAGETNSATRYIRVAMAFNPPPAPEPAASTNAAEAAAAQAAAEAERARKTEETRRFNERFGRWVYTLDEFTANLLLPAQKDLWQKNEPPPGTAAPAPESVESTPAPGDAP